MKINLKTLGTKIMTVIMRGIKDKSNIITVGPNNGKIKFTNVLGNSTDLDLGVLTKDFVNKYSVSHSGVINVNPSGTLFEKDYENYIDNNPAKHSISTDSPQGAVSALRCIGYYGADIITDTPIPMPKNKKYRVSVDVKSLKDGVEEPGGKSSFYFGYVPYDGDSVNWDSKNKMYLGNIILHECVTFRGTDLQNKDTVFKYILTRDFNNGDTFFYFRTSDINNYYTKLQPDGSPILYHNNMKFYSAVANGEYCYIAKNGKKHEHLGYSADIILRGINVQDDSKAKDDPLRYFLPTGNTIDGELEYKAKFSASRMWRGEHNTYPAGSLAVQSISEGGSYPYYIVNRVNPINGKYNNYTSDWIDCSKLTGMNGDGNKYLNGTAFIKLLLLPNFIYIKPDGTRGNRNDITSYYGNISFEYQNTDLT